MSTSEVRSSVTLRPIILPEPKKGGWRGLLRWLWWFVAGTFFCFNPLLSIIALGWLTRWTQSRVLWGWWRSSDRRDQESFPEFGQSLSQPVIAHPRWLWGEPLLASQPQTTWQKVKRFFYVPFGSLWLNLKTGVVMLFAMQLLLGLPCLLMHFGWVLGWLNSFNKGYEQAWMGPTFSLLGILLFVLAMLYIPMARAHLAVTGRLRSFFEVRFIWRLARIRLAASLGLAAVIALLSVPLEILKTLPLGFDDGYNPLWANATDAEVQSLLNNYYGLVSLILFGSMILSLMLSARVYRKSLLRALERGDITREELSERVRSWLARLDALPSTDQTKAPVVVRGLKMLVRPALYSALVVIWLLFTFKVYVGEFFQRHRTSGFLNHALVQIPCLTNVPKPPPDLTPP